MARQARYTRASQRQNGKGELLERLRVGGKAMDKLKIEYLKTDELIPYANNPRNNDEAVDYVANSIKEFGFKVPCVIDNEKNVVCGHTRLKAAKKLGIKEVPCIIADDLTEEQIKAFRLSDNKVGEFAEWDFNLLDEELNGIFDIDMSDFGFELEDEEEKENEEKPEVEFTEILGEENNYIILKFDNSVDWLQVETILGLKPVKAYSTRKDGKITKNMQRSGIGRVIDGADFFNKIGVSI